jgi:ABC-type phosphate/phosphonate transport system permease subunit
MATRKPGNWIAGLGILLPTLLGAAVGSFIGLIIGFFLGLWLVSKIQS